MINKFLLSTLFFFGIISFNALVAQPIITHSVIPVAGDSSIMAVDTIHRFEGANGANATWNFRTLRNNYSIKRLYKLPSQTLYDSACPGANMVRTDDVGSFYAFYNLSNSNLTYFGFIQPGVQSQTYNINPIDYYRFPINYNDSYTDSLKSFTVPGFLEGNGIYFFDADAYGTLQLPNQTFNNTLRVKSIYYIGDSTVGSYSLTTEFVWYEANTKEPLLVIEKVIVDDVLAANYILFNNNYPTGIINPNANWPTINMFPNPAKNKLHIHCNSNFLQSITITNTQGEKLQSMQSENFEDVEVDVSTLASGIYFVTIIFQNGEFETRKFLK